MFGNAKQGAPASSLKIAPCVALCGEQPLQHLQHEKHEFQLSSAPYNICIASKVCYRQNIFADVHFLFKTVFLMEFL
jgi:hypothetical protein